jgi:hypothetical protein
MIFPDSHQERKAFCFLVFTSAMQSGTFDIALRSEEIPSSNFFFVIDVAMYSHVRKEE